jgi:hypothetical protein
MTSTQPTERVYRRLRIVRVAAFVDLVLLLALVSAALTGQRELVHILGPLHGINYLLLLAIVGTAAIDGIWGWWFPIAILLTAGPPGAFVGEWIIHRRIREQNATAHNDDASKTTIAAIKEQTSVFASPSPSIRDGLVAEQEE